MTQSGQGRCADAEGATAVEYAIMVSLIAVAIFGTVVLLGLSIPPIFQEVIDGFA